MEKARIRRQVFNTQERSELINALYQRLIKQPAEKQPVKAVPAQEKIQVQTKGKTKK